MFIKNDCWYLIKTFAGIYSIATDWDKALTLSINSLNDLYASCNNGKKCKIANVTTKTLRSKKIYILHHIIVGQSKSAWIKLNNLLQFKYAASKHVNVGCEVLYKSICGAYNCGVVTKVNPKSINVTPYKSNYITNTWDKSHFQTAHWDKLNLIHYSDLVYTFDTIETVDDVSKFEFIC
jgi:hypothetical protein